ncbi:sugar efflux transporter A [Enterobacter ludwigii]|nr:sugar efflux transporter A [Enterobacter ludwigii]
MLWLMTMGRRLNGVYAAFMLVAFMMGVAGGIAGSDAESVSQP